MKMLLDPLEQQSDLPALPIELCDENRRQVEIVGNGRNALAGVFGFLVRDNS